MSYNHQVTMKTRYLHNYTTYDKISHYSDIIRNEQYSLRAFFINKITLTFIVSILSWLLLSASSFSLSCNSLSRMSKTSPVENIVEILSSIWMLVSQRYNKLWLKTTCHFVGNHVMKLLRIVPAPHIKVCGSYGQQKLEQEIRTFKLRHFSINSNLRWWG